eukprot:12929898-Prorocentrum_lima.AAC.1
MRETRPTWATAWDGLDAKYPAEAEVQAGDDSYVPIMQGPLFCHNGSTIWVSGSAILQMGARP